MMGVLRIDIGPAHIYNKTKLQDIFYVDVTAEIIQPLFLEVGTDLFW